MESRKRPKMGIKKNGSLNCLTLLAFSGIKIMLILLKFLQYFILRYLTFLTIFLYVNDVNEQKICLRTFHKSKLHTTFY